MGLLDALKDKQFRSDVGNGLLDLVNGLSRGVGQNVTGLVDLAALPFQAAGLNMPAPVGGSQWAENAGILPKANYTNRLAGLLGEGFGGVAPMVAAAKAPQIANGLLAMGENLAAPQVLNKQTGAIVWHGSPHKFTPTKNNPLGEFDSTKIGTGEKNQAYGYGHYLAGEKAVSDEYASKLSKPIVDFKNGEPLNEIEHALKAQYEELAGRTQSSGRAQAVYDLWLNHANPVNDFLYGNSYAGVKPMPPDKLARRLEIRDAARRLGQPDIGDAGHLYKVDLPDEHIAKMLDWDKPIMEQPHIVDALKNHPQANYFNGYMKDPQMWSDKTDWQKGKDLYGQLDMVLGNGAEGVRSTGNGVAAANALRDAGIPGIRYLDGGSRGAGAGTSNYVVFPGNEGLLSILERNGTK
jgi:hypothetical protein